MELGCLGIFCCDGPIVCLIEDLAALLNAIPFCLHVGISVLAGMQVWLIRSVFETLEGAAKKLAEQDIRQV